MIAAGQRLAWLVALGASLGVGASVTRADLLVTAIAVYSLGIVWLPALALGAAYLAFRRNTLLVTFSIAFSGAVANYLTNVATLSDELRPHAWLYALVMLFTALFAIEFAIETGSGVRRLTRRCS